MKATVCIHQVLCYVDHTHHPYIFPRNIVSYVWTETNRDIQSGWSVVGCWYDSVILHPIPIIILIIASCTFERILSFFAGLQVTDIIPSFVLNLFEPYRALKDLKDGSACINQCIIFRKGTQLLDYPVTRRGLSMNGNELNDNRVKNTILHT